MRLISDDAIRAFVRRTIWHFCCENETFARRFNDYLLFFYSAPQSVGSLRNHAERVRFNQLYLRPPICSHGGRMRSKEEQLLANWLAIHRIQYNYSEPFRGNSDYRPTFSIRSGTNVAYIDILQTDKGGGSFYGLSYLKTCVLRKRIHQRSRTNYLQISTHDWDDNSAYGKVAKFLKQHNIRSRRLPEAEILRLIILNSTYRKDFDAFLDYLAHYLAAFKNSMKKFRDINAEILKMDSYCKMRAKKYFAIFRPLYAAYQRWLEAEQQYDFADMINLAIQNVRDIPECADNYRYILLDEAQDLSPNRYQLISEILKKNVGCRFFAVGDDWQSIYRFTGSNLALIYQFEHFFRLKTRRSLIEQTHRFGQPTIRTSSNFVTKNPGQVAKNIRGNRRSHTPISIILNETRNDDTDALIKILQKVNLSDEIQIISRYNHDIYRLKEHDGVRIVSPEAIMWQNIRIPFCSMHKSKGITRDIVIVLNMNSTTTGMPATRENDPLTDILLSAEESYPFAEERRLFYVAITRARKATYLIAERRNPSPFLFEISEDLNDLYQKLCPRCKTGELVKRNDRYYCANYRYGCNFTKRIQR